MAGLAEQVKVRPHYNSRTQMVVARDWAAVKRVLGNQPNCSLSLNVGALVDRGMDGLLLEERHDFLE